MNKDRTAGNRTTVRLSNGYSLLRHVNAIATAWGLRPGSFPLAQQRAKLVAVVAVVAVMAAAYGVFGRLQVTDFDFDVFLLHFNFPFSSCFVSEESFLAVH
jgi:hypothetical protein